MIPDLSCDIDEDYREWLEKYPEKIVEIEKGKNFRIGDVLFEFLAPDLEQSVANSNQASIVLKIYYEENTLLLTGDYEVEVLEGLVEKKAK